MPKEESVPEQLMKLVEEMYNGATARVRTECGVLAEFPVTVGLHQGSALIPFLFAVDVLSESLTKEESGYGSYCMQLTWGY